ncbi:MAG: carboxypeptidase regulatory-like domain-containing protein [Acidobacteria bacterium]|nr:carboxypeptidase regulatory-like domain-containing protein [Acidobacteriota bacterium]
MPRVPSPLAGMVRSATGAPLPNALLLVQGISPGLEAFLRVLRSAGDGSFVIPDARPGVYSLVASVPGLPAASTRVMHRDAATGAVSFVVLDIPRASGVIEATALGERDPWTARAFAAGDVLRDERPTVGAPAPPMEGIVAALSGLRLQDPHGRVAPLEGSLPLHASVASLASFGTSGGSAVSETAIDLSSGNLGAGSRTAWKWGLEGRLGRTANDASPGNTGGYSRFAIDVARGGDQQLRISSRRDALPIEALAHAEPPVFRQHRVDWEGATSLHGRAGVSAELTSQDNLLSRGPVAGLFSRSTSAFDVGARYEISPDAGEFVRLQVGYRTSSSLVHDGNDINASLEERETRLGGTASFRVWDVLVLEGGATGSISPISRAVTPEVRISVVDGGFRIYGFVSRRFEARLEGYEALPVAATTATVDGELARLSRSHVRAGLRYEWKEGQAVSIEASRRDIDGTFRLLLDPEFFDQLDSIYFLPGDSASELAFAATFNLTTALAGRVEARAGRSHGERIGIVEENSASYGRAEAALLVKPSQTTFGLGYRTVSQELVRSNVPLRNDLSAMDLKVAQVLPIPVLRSLGSEWKALLSMELGTRREGLSEERSNRRFAGGLGLSF